MSWYSHWWIAVVLYGSIALVSSLITYRFLISFKLEAKIERKQLENVTSWAILLFHVHALIWSSIGQLGSSFIFFWMSVGYFGMILLSQLTNQSSPSIKWWTYPLATFLPLWWTTTFAFPILCLFIPLTGMPSVPLPSPF